jgi:hypothetical protein
MLNKQVAAAPHGWLAFELNVLRRLKFASVILPFADEPYLGAHLKRLNARVSTNDSTQAGFVKAVAAIENNGEKLSEEEIAVVLEDVYIPRHRLQNDALKNWFGEIDALWFDNVRANIDKLPSHIKQAVGLSVGLSVGDYVFSFSDETRELRQPLSKVFERLVKTLPELIGNNQENVCRNKTAKEFVAENFTADLMFLRLPPASNENGRNALGQAAWREEWIHGDDKFWSDFEQSRAGRLGAQTETKAQYLRFLEDILQTAAHVPSWAVAHVEDGFISAQDIAETVGRIRRVDTIFTKDFSELTGTKAVIITA